MSYDIAQEFLRRAKEYLQGSELTFEKSLYEVSALNSEVSAQLALKGLLFKLEVEPSRTHGIRELLALLGEKKVSDFSRERLIILENIRGKSQYGLPLVSKDEAEIALITAKEIVESLWNLQRK